jgi:hypothetical protein
MQVLVKLLYLLLFVTFDILLYLKLGRKTVRINSSLIVITLLLAVAILLHLPVFKLINLMPLRYFLTLVGMVVQLIIVHFVGILIIKRTQQKSLLDAVKEQVINALSLIFKTAIFFIFALLHILFILLWQ